MSSSVVGRPHVRPRAVEVTFRGDRLCVLLADGREVRVPLSWSPRLDRATAAERAEWRLVGDGVGVTWDGIDEDLSVAGLLGMPEA